MEYERFPAEESLKGEVTLLGMHHGADKDGQFLNVMLIADRWLPPGAEISAEEQLHLPDGAGGIFHINLNVWIPPENRHLPPVLHRGVLLTKVSCAEILVVKSEHKARALTGLNGHLMCTEGRQVLCVKSLMLPQEP